MLPTRMVRVVYIAGAARSGSTVLDTILGNAQGVESVGELFKLARSGWAGAEYCSCGEPGDRCPFWTRVRARFEAAGFNVEQYARLSEEVERRRKVSLPLFGTRGRLGPTLGRGFERDRLEPWGRATAELMRSILDEAGAEVLVDSSKSPERALALSLLPEVDLYLIHLVRDGRGMAWSLSKSIQKDLANGVQREIRGRSVTRTALIWSVVNTQVLRVAKRLPPERKLLLRYEDYLESLETALEPLVDFAGPGVVEAARRAVAGEELPLGHTIAGNRLRMNGAIRLQADHEWREKLNTRDRRRFERVGAPLLRRFGYET